MITKIKYYLSILGIKGLIYAIRAKATNSTLLLTIKRDEVKIPFNLRITSNDPAVYEQIFLKKEYEFILERLPKTIIDAGANIGLASIYFSNKYPEAKIIAIEPEENNFSLLRENVKPLNNVTVIHAALWDKNEDVNLVDPGLGESGFMTEDKNELGNFPRKFRHSIKGITIDKLIEDYELHTIDILKIDIEGAEKEIFKDTLSWIERVNMLIIELHERMKPGCSRNFYNGSNGFDYEWQQGENIYLARKELGIIPPLA
jgi:FkbM family methyltransferase